jgi:hypothetical protein
MGNVVVEMPESQVVEIVRRLSPESKRAILGALIQDLDKLDSLVEYGGERIREICVERSVAWDALSEEERLRLVDKLLHEQ